MTLTDGLLAWAKCTGCSQILWTENSIDDQACGCECGGVQIINDEATGTIDPAFLESDMEAILEAEI